MATSFVITLFVPILVIVVMFGLGLSLTLDDFKRLALYPKAALVGLTNQLALQPLVGLGVAYLFSLNPELAVGLVVVAASPGGVSSNVLIYLLKAETALSLSLTAMSNLIAFLTIPVWVGLALALFMGRTDSVSLPFLSLARQVALLTLLPVGLGLVIGRRWPGFAHRAQATVKTGSGVLLVVGIVALLIDQWENLATSWAQAGLAAATFFFCATMLAYYTATWAKLKPTARITIALESGIQNAPLSLVTATSILGNPGFAVPPIAYGLIQVLLITLILLRVISPRPKVRFPAGNEE